MKKIFLIGLIWQISYGQEILTLPKAIEIAKNQNLGIKIAKQGVAVSQMQVYKGNAGMSPTINLNGNVGSALNRVKQNLSNGTEIIRPNGRSFAPNTNVALAWTLYDGKRMNAVYERLHQNVTAAENQVEQIENQTLAVVYRAYADIQKQVKSINTLKTLMRYYEEKKKISEERWLVGRGNKLDFLQSSVDLNNQQSELIRAENTLASLKTTLNGILEQPLDTEFNVELGSMTAFSSYTLENLKIDARKENVDIKRANQNIVIAKVIEKEFLAAKMPRVFLNSSYGYALNNSNAGFILLNQNLGLNASLGASWNIFNGNLTKKNIETSKLQTQILEQSQDDIWSGIASQMRKAFQQFETEKKVLDLEKQNLTLAEENLTIALEKFKMGASTILELNQAQQSYDLAANKIILTEYTIRISEIELLRLSGKL